MVRKIIVVELKDGTKVTQTVRWGKDVEEGKDLFGVHLVERAMMETVFKEMIDSLIKNNLPFNSIKSITFPEVDKNLKEK